MKPTFDTPRISSRALITYFILAFGITWGLSIPAIKNILPWRVPSPVSSLSAILLHYGPAIAALVMVGRRGIKKLLKRLTIWRVGYGWYLFIFMYPLVLRLAAVGLDAWLGGKPPEFFSNAGVPGVNPMLLIPVVSLVVFFQAGLAEEIGWRGYALPGLEQRYGALTSSLILGFIWGAWHFHPQNFPHLVPLAFWYFFDILPFTILLTWVYNNTSESLLLVALFHTVSNVSDWIVPTFPAVASAAGIRPFILQGCLGWIAAILVVVFFGSKTLTRLSQLPRGSGARTGSAAG